MIADAIAKGIDGFDLELAYKAMTHSADEDRFGLAAYKRDGFIDAREEAEGVSRTLEYAYDDWTIAQVAGRLGRTSTTTCVTSAARSHGSTSSTRPRASCAPASRDSG